MKYDSRLPRSAITMLLANCICSFAQAGSELWSFDANSPILSSPTLGHDGTVYIATGYGLLAVTNGATGASNKWTVAVPIIGSPAVGEDGAIYFGDASSNKNLNAINRDGSQKWAFPVQPDFQAPITFQSSPAIGMDNTIYFIAGGKLYAVSPSGGRKWSFEIEDSSLIDRLSPVVSTDGTIYVGSALSRTLYAVNHDGTEKWSVRDFSWNCGESPAVDFVGNVYITAGFLYAYNSTGSNLWRSALVFEGSSPVITRDGSILVAEKGTKSLYALVPGGTVKWQALNGGSHRFPSTCAAADAGGSIYYCVSNSVWALTSQGQVEWMVSYDGYVPPNGSAAITSPTIGPDGVLYVALGTELYAIATGTNSSADSPWPMYRGNARHTGKIEKPALKQPKKRADANFEFQLYAQLGQTNVIETSTNLNTWASLTSIVVTTVPQPVVDLTASNHPSRLYRTVSP